MRVGRAVRPQKSASPTIELRIGADRREKGREAGFSVLGIIERIGAGIIFDIAGAEIGRREIEMDGAFEAKLRGTVREMGGRDVVAEAVLRPI